MKKRHALWIGSLLLLPVGCNSHHELGEGDQTKAHTESTEEEADGDEEEEMESRGAPESAEEYREASAEVLATVALDFDKAAPGTVPDGWRIEATNQQGPLATWKVIADGKASSPPNVLALTSPNHVSGGTFNLCWTDKVKFKDGSIEVSMKPISGKEDQGGGLIWRAKSKDDYYICRANPLESNFRVYYVKNASRHQLASVTAEIAAGAWHTLRVDHEGEHIVCSLDGKRLLEAKDSTFPDEGGIGLWTKADAASQFDDLKVTIRAASRPDADDHETVKRDH